MNAYDLIYLFETISGCPFDDSNINHYKAINYIICELSPYVPSINNVNWNYQNHWESVPYQLVSLLKEAKLDTCQLSDTSLIESIISEYEFNLYPDVSSILLTGKECENNQIIPETHQVFRQEYKYNKMNESCDDYKLTAIANKAFLKALEIDASMTRNDMNNAYLRENNTIDNLNHEHQMNIVSTPIENDKEYVNVHGRSQIKHVEREETKYIPKKTVSSSRKQLQAKLNRKSPHKNTNKIKKPHKLGNVWLFIINNSIFQLLINFVIYLGGMILLYSFIQFLFNIQLY